MKQKIFYTKKKFKNMIKPYFDQTIKLLVKSQEIVNHNPSNTKKKPDIENLIFYLIDLLNNWNVDKANNDIQSDQLDSFYKKDLM